MINIKEKLNQAGQCIKSKIKQILIAFGIIGVCLAAGNTILNPPIPADLQLKTTKENILYSQDFTQYQYDASGTVISETPMVSYTYKSGELAPVLDNEIIEQRTENIVTRNLGGNKRSAQSGYNFYKEGNDWKQIKFATTTKEVFDKATLSGWINIVFAAQTASTSPGTMATSSEVGTVDWIDINNAKIEDDTDTYVIGLAEPWVSYYLKATNFGFNISSSTIDGILVEVREIGQFGCEETIYENAIRIVKGGNIGSTDKSTTTPWPTSYTYVSYGGSTDKWGETWAYTDINLSTFGFAISVKDEVGYECRAYLDHIRITVFFSETGGAVAEPDLFKRMQIIIIE